jgi:RteC protein
LLHHKLHTILDDYERLTQQPIFGYLNSIDVILYRINLFVSYNSELIELENSFEFKSTEDEIKYYKYEKPKFQKYGIFYNSISKLELHMPMGSKKTKSDYYEKELDQITNTFRENEDIIVYHRMKGTERDKDIFVRSSPNNHIFAIIEATSMMEEFLYNINDPRSIDDKIQDYPKLTWTGKLTDLVILVRALVLSGSINNGQATIKDVVTYVQVMFNVDLKDYHRKYSDIKASQNPTKFLDYLIDVIVDDIDQQDEKASNQKKK